MSSYSAAALCLVLAILLDTSALEIKSANGTKDAAANSDIKLPSEVQKAVCTVTAGEVRASAEAVTTKTLKGVCGSDEMNMAFRKLEVKLYEELREIKLLLGQLVQAQGLQGLKSVEAANPAPSLIKILKFEHIADAETKMLPKLRQLESEQTNAPLEREQEVHKFNNTMLADQDFRLFTYYWKLENFTQRIANATTVRSPVFSIKGRTLQLKCTFHHLHRELLHLQLGLAHSPNHNNNIVLDMGGLFKQIKVTEHELFKHKISILDQSNRHGQDLSSQELSSFEAGFSIPNSALLGSPYIKHNMLLIQIILYL